jgi:hypothetical protein
MAMITEEEKAQVIKEYQRQNAKKGGAVRFQKAGKTLLERRQVMSAMSKKGWANSPAPRNPFGSKGRSGGKKANS